jgi:hypothetical protein
MRVKGLRNSDGKIAGRVARDPVLQVDDNSSIIENAP